MRRPFAQIASIWLGCLWVATVSNSVFAQEPKVSVAVDGFSGFLVPANATEVFAPEASFRVAGWRSGSNSIKLVELTPDGQQVKTGDFARFEFTGKGALEYIQGHIRRTEADANENAILGEQTRDNLQIARRRKELEAQLAALNIERERAISKKQAAIFRVAKKIADFEVEAVQQQIAAKEKAIAAEKSYYTLASKSAQQDLLRYQSVEKRFDLKAPHDGIVRHSFNPRERRKIQKGDGLNSGWKVMAVAKDATLAVKFFVPESRIKEVTVGAKVMVTTPSSAAQTRGTITHIDFFPQEMGFLLEAADLPGSRDKAVSVMAILENPPAELVAGVEARVKASQP